MSSSAMPRLASTKPTATWLSQSVMLEKATMRANVAPTAAAAANPSQVLPLSKATAKPASAESMRLPSIDRLMTPAFSLIVSPERGEDERDGRGDDGGERRVHQASGSTVVASGCVPGRALVAAPRLASGPRGAQAVGEQGEEDEDAREHAADRGVHVEPQRQRDAADRDDGEEGGDRRHVGGAEPGQQDDEDAEEPVAARDGGHELVVEARGLDGAGQPGQGAADGEGQEHEAVGGDAEEPGAHGVAPDRLEPEAEARPAQHEPDGDERRRW